MSGSRLKAKVPLRYEMAALSKIGHCKKQIMPLGVEMAQVPARAGAVLGSVENQDSPLRLGVIQAFDG